jgi:ferredoxin
MPDKKADYDIFSLMSNEKAKKEKPANDILAQTGIKVFFKDGKISVNTFTCTGVQCKICIKACPTNALYWKTSGEIGIIPELCIYCGACVLSCMVDNCIKIERKRDDGTIEKFSKPAHVYALEEKISGGKRVQRAISLLTPDESKP